MMRRAARRTGADRHAGRTMIAAYHQAELRAGRCVPVARQTRPDDRKLVADVGEGPPAFMALRVRQRSYVGVPVPIGASSAGSKGTRATLRRAQPVDTSVRTVLDAIPR